MEAGARNMERAAQRLQNRDYREGGIALGVLEVSGRRMNRYSKPRRAARRRRWQREALGVRESAAEMGRRDS